jgi:hypothetical protein
MNVYPMNDCKPASDETEYYELRARSVYKKYGAQAKNLTSRQYYYTCDTKWCTNPDHFFARDTIFVEVGRKPCSKCKVWKTESEFYLHPGSPNGRSSQCIICAGGIVCAGGRKDDKPPKFDDNGNLFCNKCQQYLPTDQFYINRKNKTGLTSACKKCTYAYTRRPVLSKKEQYEKHVIRKEGC